MDSFKRKLTHWRTKMFRNDWFHDRQMIKPLPAKCVQDFAGSGDKTEACEYWIKKLNFDGPAWLIREHLSGCGAWTKQQLCDHQENLRRLLFVHACSENGMDLLYLMG